MNEAKFSHRLYIELESAKSKAFIIRRKSIEHSVNNHFNFTFSHVCTFGGLLSHNFAITKLFILLFLVSVDSLDLPSNNNKVEANDIKNWTITIRLESNELIDIKEGSRV